MKWLRSIAICCIVTIFLFALWGFKTELSANKDFVGVIKDIITIFTIVVGSILSYFKFFKGLTFGPKADIEFDIVLIETPHESVMHIIRFGIVNKGTVTIWNPVAKISIRSYFGKEEITVVVDGLRENSFYEETAYGYDTIVDVGEKGYFIHHREFPKSTWAVAYDVEVTSKGNHRWKSSITVPNTKRASIVQ